MSVAGRLGEHTVTFGSPPGAAACWQLEFDLQPHCATSLPFATTRSPHPEPRKPLSAGESTECLIVSTASGFKCDSWTNCQLPCLQAFHVRRCWTHRAFFFPERQELFGQSGAGDRNSSPVFPNPQKHRLLTLRPKDLSQMKFSRKISKAGLQREASHAYLCYVKRDPGSTPGSILTLLAVQTVHFPWVGGWDLGESCFFSPNYDRHVGDKRKYQKCNAGKK